MGCLIRVDPDEMTSTASVLQATASELTDIGGGVQSQCGGCCLPAGVEGQVLAEASAVESSLGGIASDLGGQATDLSSRAVVVANDSLPTAASAASAPGAEVGSAFGVTMEVGGPIGYMTVGGLPDGMSLDDLLAMPATSPTQPGYWTTRAMDDATAEIDRATTIDGARGPTAQGGLSLGSLAGNNFSSSLLNMPNSTGNASIHVIPSITEVRNAGDQIIGGGGSIGQSRYEAQFPGGMSSSLAG